MSTAFSFGFSGDDIEDELDSGWTQAAISSDEQGWTAEEILPAKELDIKNMVNSLPSCISYGFIDVPLYQMHASGSSTVPISFTRLPRRSHFDIRAQLMAESCPGENSNDRLISGLDAGDLSSGNYEGGFKTWECAVDLAGFISQDVTLLLDGWNWHIIELGAGSAIPSLVLLEKALRKEESRTRRIQFTFCDYNEEVLQLVTLPNILLSWWEVCGRKQSGLTEAPHSTAAELDGIDEALVLKFLGDCRAKGIDFQFVSGAWGASFLELVLRKSIASQPTGQSRTVILASETIYSPSTLSPFARTLLSLLKVTGGLSEGFVAAKRVYFGVGGGVQEFVEEMTRLGGRVNEIQDSKDDGVGRAILRVSGPQTAPETCVS